MDAEALDLALKLRFGIQTADDGAVELSFASGEKVPLAARDRRQYGSVAYSLRAILAARQKSLFGSAPLLPLADDELGRLREAADLVGLALLQVADGEARGHSVTGSLT